MSVPTKHFPIFTILSVYLHSALSVYISYALAKLEILYTIIDYPLHQ